MSDRKELLLFEAKAWRREDRDEVFVQNYDRVIETIVGTMTRAEQSAAMVRLLRDGPRVRNQTLIDLYNMSEETRRAAALQSLIGSSTEATDPVGSRSVEVDLAAYIEYTEPKKKIARPPGAGMRRLADLLFFFSPKTVERVFGDIIATYQHEMIKAEGDGAPPSRLLSLQVQYWGGFIWSLFDQVVFGFVGKIIKTLKGG